MTTPTVRQPTIVHAAQPTSDGAGVSLSRALGTHGLSYLDPFLMLDEFRSDDPNDYIAGFPSHPHRGFETVTYMLAGSIEHKDSVGNTGNLVAGSVQWMTAGRGIIHSEMPRQENGLMWGFQLWVNLPADQKMTAPRYQDIAPERIPVVSHDGLTVRVIAGTYQGTTGPVEGVAVQPTMLDVRLDAKSTFALDLPREHTAFLYVFEGEVTVGGREKAVPRGHTVVLGEGDRVSFTSANGGRAMLFAGRPLREPVARFGPFVMNTEVQIRQAVNDFRAGRFLSA